MKDIPFCRHEYEEIFSLWNCFSGLRRAARLRQSESEQQNRICRQNIPTEVHLLLFVSIRGGAKQTNETCGAGQGS